jgi:hypothetical protein
VTFKDGQSSMRLGMALEKRLMIDAQLPAGHKQLLILSNADHMTFAGEPVDPQQYSRDVKLNLAQTLSQWSRISEVSKLFWQFYLSTSNHPNEAEQKLFHKQLILYQNTGDILKFG